LINEEEDTVSYEDDETVKAFVREHPDGATLEEVAQALGLTKQRIHQIEVEALNKLRAHEGLPPRPGTHSTPYVIDQPLDASVFVEAPAPVVVDRFESLDGQRSMLALASLEKAAAKLDMRTVEELSEFGDIVREWDALVTEQNAQIAATVCGMEPLSPEALAVAA
jgi:hypothetical protein